MYTTKLPNGNVYLNATITNDVLGKDSFPATLNRVLQDPVLDNPSLYDMVITRFSIPGRSIPLFNFQVQRYPNTDINKGIYSLGMESMGISTAPIYLEWIPQTLNPPQIPTFSITNPGPAKDDSYYENFSYQNLVNMINIALAQASSGFAGVDCYMTFDAETGLFSLYGKNMQNVKLWFSSPLQLFFLGFKNVHKAYNSPSGQDEMILFEDNRNNVLNGFVRNTTEFNGDCNLQALSRILLLSSSFGGVSPQAEVYDSQNEYFPYQSIITDFIPEASTQTGSYRSKFQFYVGSEFQRRTLTSSSPMINVHLEFVWQCRASKMHPLRLQPGDNLSIQFLFTKKI
jgi:hypothetical protein